MGWLDFGETVTVIRRGAASRDAMGHRVDAAEERETVENVVVAPPDTAVLTQLDKDATATLHFPKGYAGSLRGCEIEVRGVRYAVIGDPMAYNEDATPGEWNMPVHVGHTRRDGGAYGE